MNGIGVCGALAILLAVGACSDYRPMRSTLALGPNATTVAQMPGSGLPARVEGPLLQACVDHASAAQKAQWQSDFTMMRFDSDNLEVARVGEYAGKRYVEARLKGQGGWWGYNDEGAGEYRAIKFGCLLDKSGAVYTLVQAQ